MEVIGFDKKLNQYYLKIFRCCISLFKNITKKAKNQLAMQIETLRYSKHFQFFKDESQQTKQLSQEQKMREVLHIYLKNIFYFKMQSKV